MFTPAHIARTFLVSVVAAWLAAPAFSEPTDFFALHTGLDPDTVRYIKAWSGDPNAVESLRARLSQVPPPANALDGWSLLCKFGFRTGNYAQAIHDCSKAVELDPKGGDADTLAKVKLLEHQPAPRAYGSARVPVSPGVQIPVTAGDYRGVAMADTGAGISFMMQSVARTAGVKMLGASGKVGTSTASVDGRLGLISEVRIGGAVVKNIPVVVMPDAKLTFSHGKETVKIPFLLSLNSLANFGRVAWLDHDKWLALGSAAPTSFPGAVPMIWHPLGIAVPLAGPGGVRAAHFDSGANISFLFDRALPLLSSAERAQIVETTRTLGGIGGVIEEKVRKLPVATFVLAGHPLVLKDVKVVKEPHTGEAARLGEDVLQSYSAVVFDFGAMTFSVSP
jgi:hypothetical protein